MKKRIFALALALCMMLSAMPTSFAGNGFLTDDSKAAPQSGILTDDSKPVSQSGVLTGASKYYRDGILYNTGSQSGASYSLPSGTLNAPTGILTLDENVDSTTTLSGSGISAGTRSSALVTDDKNGLELAKKVDKVGDNYKITLEAYVTGKKITTTHTAPMDIVLVLDQSGSMAYKFDGTLDEHLEWVGGWDGGFVYIDDTKEQDRRQYAMKQAVNKFINAVYEKYDATDSDHRMAIVTFSDSAAKLQGLGWTYVNESGKTTLTEAINGLPVKPTGGTQTDLGMAEAEKLMDPNADYGYAGTNTSARQKVVILFTDGVPGSDGFDTNVADKALASAKVMKDKGVVIYTVGIFNGADKNELHGKEWAYVSASTIPCTGEVGSYWGGSWLSSLTGKNDFDEIDIAAGNRFLNYLSSNSETSTKIGITKGRYNPGNVTAGGGTGWRIDANALSVDTTKGYYKTANDIDSLNNIFQSIQESIGGADDTTLTSETVVQDAVSKYFQIPSGSSATAHTETYTGEVNGVKMWSRNSDAWNLSPVKNSDGTTTVTATSFDFSENWVGPDENDNPHGKKLVIEIPIEPKTGFLGGNGVPTNDDANAGIYLADKLIENFPNTGASTNVGIADVTVDVTDKNIYLSQTLDDSGLLADTTVKVGSVELNMTDTTTYGLEAWQYAYVTISTNVATNTGAKWTDDEVPFTLTCTVKTKDETVVKSGGDTANVNVFKPVVTFQDSTIYLGTTPDYEAVDEITGAQIGNYQSAVWKHETTVANVSKMGTAPGLMFNYAPEKTAVPTDCGGVDVTAAIEEKNVTQYVTFVNGESSHAGLDNAKEFTVHVVKPVITSEDITIYLSNTVDLNGQMTVAGNWVCGHTGSEQKSLPANNGETRLAPTIDYTFMVGSAPVSTATAYQPLGCTEINVTATVNGKDAPISTDTAGKDYSTFQIHVLKPAFTVTCTDLWADYGTNVTLANHLNTTVTGWSDSTAEHTGIPTVNGSAPTVFTYTYEVKDVGEKVVETHTVTENDADFTVELASFKIGALDCGTRWSEVTVNKVDGADSDHNFTIHTNKFDLTISKTWKDGENVADGTYKQDAIFTVSGGLGEFQVVLPAGQESITVKNLLCGQDYTVTEDSNWTWRWNDGGTKTVTTHKHGVTTDMPTSHTASEGATAETSVENSVSFINTLVKQLWFDFCKLVQNIFGVGKGE